MTEGQSNASKWGTFGMIATIVGWFIFIVVAFALKSYFVAGIGLLISTIGELSLAVAFTLFLMGK